MVDTSRLPRFSWDFTEIFSVAKWWISNFSPFVMIGTAFAVSMAVVLIIVTVMHGKDDKEEDKGYDEEYF